MHTNMAEFRNKQSLSSIVIALRTQRTPRDSMTVLFLSILILASLQPFCFLDEVADFSPPANSFQPTVELYSLVPAAAECLALFLKGLEESHSHRYK